MLLTCALETIDIMLKIYIFIIFSLEVDIWLTHVRLIHFFEIRRVLYAVKIKVILSIKKELKKNLIFLEYWRFCHVTNRVSLTLKYMYIRTSDSDAQSSKSHKKVENQPVKISYFLGDLRSVIFQNKNAKK